MTKAKPETPARAATAWRRFTCAALVAMAMLHAGCVYTNTVVNGVRSALLSKSKQNNYVFHPSFVVEEPEFFRSLHIIGEGMVGGNHAILLENGDQIFPAMTADIRAAQVSVNMETFIFEDDEAGRLFADALIEAASRGVKVRLTVDDWGSNLGKLEKEMVDAGVRIAKYNPLHFYTIRRPGVRTHRKLLIVDGRIGYTGGLGVDERWLGNARNEDEWRDTQVRVTGPVVAQLQGIFNENWTFTTAEILAGDDYFPALQPTGKMIAHAIKASTGDSASLPKMLYIMTIQAARQYLHITNPYFIPDAQVRRALVAAAQRGVDVRVLVPGEHNDLPMIRHNSRMHYAELLRGGVRICEYTPTMIHSKMMVVDGIFSTIGSINFDARSMSVNAEESLSVYDRDFAGAMEAMFQRDLQHCEEMEYEKWQRRSIFKRAGETIFWILEPYY
ncbi:MAG TPA: phospholipase D-like domain-containing protein [Candidatus Binatia bacterium]|nr:phospholipase D-like domain-containing protein [Candidatus Binatia bacterium]